MLKPTTTDPRAELINWDILSLESFPPIHEWTDDEWDDAALATLVHYYIEQDKAGPGKPLITFEEVMKKHGFTVDDLEATDFAEADHRD